MNRLAILVAAGICAAGLCACEHHETASLYDPQLDGVLPRPAPVPNESILENQKKLYDNMIATTGGLRTPAPAPAASAPATAPASPAATSAPAPEGEGAPAAPATPAAPPAGEGNTPAPPPPQ